MKIKIINTKTKVSVCRCTISQRKERKKEKKKKRMGYITGYITVLNGRFDIINTSKC